jgi:predicted RNase H-like HicB family nuclease
MIPNVPGAHTQAATLDELHHNLQEVLELCLEELTEEELNALPEFVGVQHISVVR